LLGIGDHLLIGPQSMSRIVTIPQANICLIQFDYLLGLNGSMSNFGQSGDHFLYANMDFFEWDEVKRFWRPRGSTGDRVTFQYNGDLFDKKLIWSMNNFKETDDMRSDLIFNAINETQGGKEKDEEVSEIYSEKPPDSQSIRSKSTSSMKDKVTAVAATHAQHPSQSISVKGQLVRTSQPKQTLYDLDVNLPHSLRTVVMASSKKQRAQQFDKYGDLFVMFYVTAQMAFC
jgi:hypothetical protein